VASERKKNGHCSERYLEREKDSKK
jgi:hypothetical protein